MGSAYQGQAPVGPAEGVSLAVVPARDEPLDRFDQLVNATEVPVAEYSTGNDREPKLDLVEPRAVGGSVVKDEAVAVATTPLAEESPHARVLVSIEVVQHHVDPGLAVLLGYQIHAGEEIEAFAR